VRKYDDPEQAIHVAPDETFAIELKGNPTTGYTWQADIDTQYAELITQEYAPQAGPAGAIGAGGWEVFHFRAREAGETQIVFLHRRPWGGATRDTKRFKLVID
jgi:inhibitor of cysteine peptidase